MPASLKIPCLILFLALPAYAPAANLQVVYPTTDAPPIRQSWFGPATAPDCATASIWTIGAGFDSTLVDSTTNRPALVNGYRCNSWNESGPEYVLGLKIEQDLFLHAVLSSTAELDLFLLDDCESDSCQAAHISEFTALLPARVAPYWLVVDGYLGAEGPFSLHLTSLGAGLDPQVCANAIPIPCGDGSEIQIPGDTFDRINYLTTATCGESQTLGGEVWYSLSVQDTVTIDITLQNIFFDGVIWLFDSCGLDATCLAYVNSGVSETSERLKYKNTSGSKRTYYLGIDSIRPYGIEYGSNIDEGRFLLKLSCAGQIVSTRKMSFKEIKSMFR